MARLLRIGVLALGCLLCAQPAYATRLSLHRLAPRGDTAGNDGKRYIAMAPGYPATYGAAVKVFDLKTGRTKTVHSPANCGFQGVSPSDALLWNCREGGGYGVGRTYNLRSRSVASLRAQSAAADDDGSIFEAIGSHWARVRFTGYHYSYFTYVNRLTGQQVQPTLTPTQTEDLNSPELVRTLCSGMRSPIAPDYSSGLENEQDPLAISGNRAAATTYESAKDAPIVVLEGCGLPPKVLESCGSAICAPPVINSKIVAWTDNPYDEETTAAATLHVYSIASGTTKTLQLGNQTATTAPSLQLLAHRLYVTSAGRLSLVEHSGA